MEQIYLHTPLEGAYLTKTLTKLKNLKSRRKYVSQQQIS